MKWKYLTFLIVPVMGLISIYSSGIWTFSAVIFAFGLIPLVELLIAPDSTNLDGERQQEFKVSKMFNGIVFLVLPTYAFITLLFLLQFSARQLALHEAIGMVWSIGIMCGVMAINVGHELGHRHNYSERVIGELLLVLTLQAHFLPYHNHGHHRNVATPNDPATARKNEPVFLFWFRSQIGSYIHAWKIEWFRLTNRDKNPFSFSNRMIRYTLLELLIVSLIYIYFSGTVLLAYLAVCFIGMLLLETVNYIEHYGLVRRCDSEGKYERVTPKHSWNSDHILGRVLLFELSRHSDHHANPSKPYQLLDSFESSPQMPTGYPGMMLLSLIPPLWFWVMNKQLARLAN